MKLVVLTNQGSSYGRGLLASLQRASVPLQAIVVLRQPLTYHWRLFRSVRRRVGLRDALYFSWKRLRPQVADGGEVLPSNYDAYGAPVSWARGTNDPMTRSILRDLAPDVLLLGQTGILKSDTIALARLGVLNAHPAILPEYRGIDCARWAVFNGDWDRIGVSVHWVDKGVDTGPLVSAVRYEISSGETLASLDRALERLSIVELTAAAQRLIRGDIPAGTPQPSGGQQYYKMSRRVERLAQDRLLAYATQRVV